MESAILNLPCPKCQFLGNFFLTLMHFKFISKGILKSQNIPPNKKKLNVGIKLLLLFLNCVFFFLSLKSFYTNMFLTIILHGGKRWSRLPTIYFKSCHVFSKNFPLPDFRYVNVYALNISSYEEIIKYLKC